MKINSLSVGQAIRRVRAKEISQVYAIYGGEYFFEECKFEIKIMFLEILLGRSLSIYKTNHKMLLLFEVI